MPEVGWGGVGAMLSGLRSCFVQLSIHDQDEKGDRATQGGGGWCLAHLYQYKGSSSSPTPSPPPSAIRRPVASQDVTI